MNTDQTIHIVGAGLAGSECAFQLAEMGHKVCLYEMRNQTMTPAHKTDQCAELVCSNSFGSIANHAAPGQLKWEAEKLGSKILEIAWQAYIPAGQALGIDRQLFAEKVTETLKQHPNIEIVHEEVQSLRDLPRPCIIATGPLTSDTLSQSLLNHFGDEFLYFFDAIAPIIDADSIDHDTVWVADRWGKGSGDYINCPLNKDEYYNLIEQIKSSETVEAKDFEKDTPYFEACMPIEEIVRRGDETLRFGPLSPKGLPHPKTDKNCYAVVQLRKENKAGTAYNLVGFQTKMKYPEQKRVFSQIPGLQNASFLKLGSIHRNMFINSTQKLNKNLSSKKDPLLFFAGQITGVEGYFESTCMGLLASHFLHNEMEKKEPNFPPRESALGSLIYALTGEEKEDFQPTNINFGLFPPLNVRARKREKRDLHIQRAREHFTDWLKSYETFTHTENFTEQNAQRLNS